jgi:acetolactate synthase-1/2/3 large subunit
MIFDFPGQFLTSAGLGTMGFGLPAGIGASLSGEMVVVVSGDGSLFMNIQEMDTAVQERSNLKLILLDNRRLGMVAQQQTLFLGRRHVASTFTTNPDFTGIARAMGWSAVNFDAEMPEDQYCYIFPFTLKRWYHLPFLREVPIGMQYTVIKLISLP